MRDTGTQGLRCELTERRHVEQPALLFLTLNDWRRRRLCARGTSRRQSIDAQEQLLLLEMQNKQHHSPYGARSTRVRMLSRVNT